MCLELRDGGTTSWDHAPCAKRILRLPIAAACAAGFLLIALGCGGDGESELSDSAAYLIEARQALGDGNTDAALQALSASIDSEPNVWAYLERAKIHATQGNDQAARADCDAALKLAPQNRDVAWIESELKKPVGKRFQGQFAIAPSFKK
jgi:hypothetical protein